ncbi:hypothetical protein J6590_004332, partial [Homalodisca vitripennis]
FTSAITTSPSIILILDRRGLLMSALSPQLTACRPAKYARRPAIATTLVAKAGTTHYAPFDRPPLFLNRNFVTKATQFAVSCPLFVEAVCLLVALDKAPLSLISSTWPQIIYGNVSSSVRYSNKSVVRLTTGLAVTTLCDEPAAWVAVAAFLALSTPLISFYWREKKPVPDTDRSRPKINTDSLLQVGQDAGVSM